jgi:capsular exopolysaccharide synthesis family protein
VSVTRGRNPVLDSLTQNYINAVTLEKEAGSRLQITRRQAEQVRGRMANLPQSEQKIGMLTSRINELQSTHAYLNGQRQALNLAMYGGLPTVMPIMNARPARFPVSPNIPVSFGLLTVLAGLLALGIAVLRDQLNDHIHTSDMLESLSGRRVLAALPQVRSGVRGLVTSPGCPMPLLEHFRILRGGLMLSALEPLPKIVVLTSPQSSEGKSTVAANLAATVALGDRRTLLIDCDLRHPSLHLIYGLRNTDGLAEILRGGATLESCLRPSGVPNLDVITAGTATGNPPELLGGAALPALLATVAEDYDTVFLDATPLVNLSDAAILARLADGVLLVVASDRTRQPELQQALRTLEQTGANVLGLVYNRDPDAKALSWQ